MFYTGLKAFAAAENEIRQSAWFDRDWSCCSGLWRTKRYGDTVVLRMTKRGWSSAFPVTPENGGEIQYAAWINEKLARKSAVRFEMHVFSFPNGMKTKKGEFAGAFRAANRAAIESFGFHGTDYGPAVPYGGSYTYKNMDDLSRFLVRDFLNFASLAGSVDRILRKGPDRAYEQ